MITFKQYLTEEVVTLDEVTSLKDLIDPKTRVYYTGTVNVTGSVELEDQRLMHLPVRFGTVDSYFTCTRNQLTSLEGAPSSVGGGFYCDFNRLTSLEGIHKFIKKMEAFSCYDNPIKSGGIGLILVEGLTQIYSSELAFDIIRKYIGKGKKGLLRCQDELIEAGYEEFARL